MRDVEGWKPSKFVVRDGRLVGTRDETELAAGSRIVGGAMAARYEMALRSYAKGSLLDLGCGKVPLFGVYRDLVTEVTCVDWAGGLHGPRHVDHFQDLNDPLEFPDKRFDTVILSDVLEHIRFPESLLAEVRRVIAPGGHAIIGVPFMYWLHEEPHDFYRFTRYALAAIAGSAGFEVIEIVETGGLPEVFSDLMGKALSGRQGLQAAFVKVAEKLLSNNRVARFGMRTRSKFPLGYLMVAKVPNISG